MTLKTILRSEDFTARVLLFCACITAAGFVLGLILSTPAKALAFLAGGTLSGLNFKLLKGAVDVAFVRTLERKKRHALTRFVLRYALILLAFYATVKISRAHLIFFLIGLFAAVAAVIVECLYQLGRAPMKS